jgi:hypothetical protein
MLVPSFSFSIHRKLKREHLHGSVVLHRFRFSIRGRHFAGTIPFQGRPLEYEKHTVDREAAGFQLSAGAHRVACDDGVKNILYIIVLLAP